MVWVCTYIHVVSLWLTAVCVDEQVAWLEIPVDDARRVDVLDATQYLVYEELTPRTTPHQTKTAEDDTTPHLASVPVADI